MIVVSYKSKRELKKAIGEPLKCVWEFGGLKCQGEVIHNGEPMFVTNTDGTFKAVVTMADGKIESVR